MLNYDFKESDKTMLMMTLFLFFPFLQIKTWFAAALTYFKHESFQCWQQQFVVKRANLIIHLFPNNENLNVGPWIEKSVTGSMNCKSPYNLLLLFSLPSFQYAQCPLFTHFRPYDLLGENRRMFVLFLFISRSLESLPN